MSFTRAEILDDIDEVQYYGRKPPVVRFQEFLERKWWLKEGHKKEALPFKGILKYRLTDPVSKTVYRIEACTVQKHVCLFCGGSTEVREGSSQVIHIGLCRKQVA